MYGVSANSAVPQAKLTRTWKYTINIYALDILAATGAIVKAGKESRSVAHTNGKNTRWQICNMQNTEMESVI